MRGQSKIEFAKELKDNIHSTLLQLSVELQYSQRYEKANQQGQYDALAQVWDILREEIQKMEDEGCEANAI
ncbi:hypothetical protein BSK48_16955 [Paenibacillus odorifer]|uniref:hypothetical protein n=1 Tax=Paenibacillus odorifer TaxID=189426 RepID=UPI00096ED320|nr:hypothetical protein [Paenibacillus odorifer]OMD69165.1 hypothetical protein BSK48_16955 [Paenibacillus odorifer]